MARKATPAIVLVSFVVLLSALHRSFVSAAENQINDAPNIDIQEATVTLAHDSNNRITCMSQLPIVWTYYAHSHRWEPPNVAFQQYKTNDRIGPHRAELELSRVSARTVGRYYCVHKKEFTKETKNMLDALVRDRKASSIYVFVEDVNQPLVPISIPSFYVGINTSFILPCKSTYPGVEVELYNVYEKHLVRDSEYDITTGYWLNATSGIEEALYYCQEKGKPEHGFYMVVFSVKKYWTRNLDEQYHHLVPTIVSNLREVVIPKGATKFYVCLYQQSIIWTHHSAFNHRVKVFQYEGNYPEKHFIAVLLLTNVSVEMVDRYYCVPQGSYEKSSDLTFDERMADYQTSSMYVFVEDPKEPLVPISNPVFSVKQFENVFLPCKPTHPSVQVELYNGLDGSLVENFPYSYTQGYILYFYQLEDVVVYVCQQRGKPDQRIRMVVQISAQSEAVSKPVINSDTRNVIPIGQCVRLVCKVNFRAGMRVDMTWTASTNLNQGITIGNISVTPIENSSDRMYAYRELTIWHAVKANSDTYRCVVNDQNNRRMYQSFKLVVIKSVDVLIDLSEEYDRYYSIVDPKRNIPTPPINITFEYWSLSSNIKYYWKKDDEPDVSEQNIAMYKDRYELTRTNTHMTLKIINPTVEDTGNYTLHVTAGHDKKTRRMGVYIHAQPIVRMESRAEFVKPGENVTFTCRAIGYPRPDVSFMYNTCLEVRWGNCSMSISQTRSEWKLPHEAIKSETATFATYSLSVSQPGLMYCRANTSGVIEVVSADLLVSPMTDAVIVQKVLPTTEEIFVRDKVVIVCSALVYNHTNEISFELKGRELRQADGVKVGYANAMFAWQANLTIENVMHEHAGDLYCKVKTFKNNYESRSIRLKLLDPVAPYVRSQLIDQTISVDLDFSFQLKCDIYGMPEPTIMWFKNNKLMLVNETNTAVNLLNTSLNFGNLSSADYGQYKCRGQNKYGTIEKKWILTMRSSSTDNVLTPSILYGFIAMLTMLIIVIMLGSLIYCKKISEIKALKRDGVFNFTEGNLDVFRPELTLGEQADLLPYNSEYEFPKERLKLGKELGAGAFGVVLMATAMRIMGHEDETTVAVKMVKKRTDNEVLRALISELKILIHLGQHLNVVNLLGAVTKNIAKRELMVIVEYCRYGNVQNFLRRHRLYFIDQLDRETQQIDIEQDDAIQFRHQHGSDMDDNGPVRTVNTTDLVCWASQVASGMGYLASRKVIHGDLAARNILLCDGNVVKICDFGLSRSMYKRHNYKKKGGGPLPFKWLALECISDNVFSTHSDVWAYGVVLWELFSLGNVPYPGMEANQELYNKLRDGYRMDTPDYSNRDIYDSMLNCWNVRPDSRPSFPDLNRKFDSMLPEEMRDHYLKLNESFMRMNAEKFERSDLRNLAHLGPPEGLAPPVPMIKNDDSASLSTVSDLRNEEEAHQLCETNSNLNKLDKNEPIYEEIQELPVDQNCRLSVVHSSARAATGSDPKPRNCNTGVNSNPTYMNVENENKRLG